MAQGAGLRSRGVGAADRGVIVQPGRVQILQLPAHLGTGSSWDCPAACMCVCWEGGTFVPCCHGRLRVHTGRSLLCPDCDPRASPSSRPGWGLGGQSSLWLLAAGDGGQVCVSTQSAGRGCWQPACGPSLRHQTCVLMRWSRCFLSIKLLKELGPRLLLCALAPLLPAAQWTRPS